MRWVIAMKEVVRILVWCWSRYTRLEERQHGHVCDPSKRASQLWAKTAWLILVALTWSRLGFPWSFPTVEYEMIFFRKEGKIDSLHIHGSSRI
jgi:hypothetical protein